MTATKSIMFDSDGRGQTSTYPRKKNSENSQ